MAGLGCMSDPWTVRGKVLGASWGSVQTCQDTGVP